MLLSYAILMVEARSCSCKILTCVSLESVGGAAFRFLIGLVTYYLSLDIQVLLYNYN